MQKACLACMLSTTKARVSMVTVNRRLSRHSVIQSSFRPSLSSATPLATKPSRTGRTSGRAAAISTSALNKSTSTIVNRCTDVFHLFLVQEFSQLKQVVHDLQLSVASNAVNVQRYKIEKPQLAATNRELHAVVRRLLSLGGIAHSSTTVTDSNIDSIDNHNNFLSSHYINSNNFINNSTYSNSKRRGRKGSQ